MKESRDKNYCSEILKVTGSRLVPLKLMGKNPMNFQLACVGIKYVFLSRPPPPPHFHNHFALLFICRISKEDSFPSDASETL